MRQARVVCAVLFTVIICLGTTCSVVDASESSGNSVTIVNAEYDLSTGILTYSGSSESDIINVVVYGHNYVSPICASIVSGGYFSDCFYLGSLKEGKYTVRFTGNNYDEEASFIVGNSNIALLSANYDVRTGLLTFMGTATTSIVNIRVHSNDYASPINACLVKNGSFSDVFYIGSLNPGTYTIEASSNGCTAVKSFIVGTEFISDIVMSFEEGLLTYEGNASSEIVNVVVYGHDYMSPTNASLVSDGRFSDIFHLGDLNPGIYTVKFTGKNCFVDKQFTITSNDDPYAEDSLYSPDGKTLIEYHGVTPEYVLPASVEKISDRAFEKASIDRFVLTKDVIWDIKIHDNIFPLQSAGVSEIVLQEGVTEVPDYLFACTEISSVVIPASVETIGVKAFYMCTNLETVFVEASNHLTTIGDYAFGTNDTLNLISFGSSDDGYSCSIGKGSFYDCATITVRLDPAFNLYSIGEGAFANTHTVMLIGDETGDKIHIPGTVGNLGKLAFSDAVNSTSNVEPGKNTLRYSEELIVTKYGSNGVTDRTIEFEPNVFLTTIEQGCFARVNPVDSIDLSGCTSLEEIKMMAFAYCLDAGSTGLSLPSNLKIIGKAAFESRGNPVSNNDNAVVLPASLEHVDAFAFERVYSAVSFESNSMLRYYDGSPVAGQYTLIDLTNCDRLEELGQYCSTNLMKMPVGVYASYRNNLPLYSDESPVVSASNGILTIASDTVGIIRGSFDSLTEIRVESSNEHFKLIGSSLYQITDNDQKLIFVLKDKSFTVDENCSSIGTGAFGSSMKTLRINNASVDVGGSIVDSATGLKYVYIGSSPASWSMPVAFEGIQEGVTFYVLDTVSEQDLAYLKTIGIVYVGHQVGNAVLYLPEEYGGKTVSYTDVVIENMVYSSKVHIGGLVPNSLDFIVTGAKASYSDGTLTVSDVSGDEAYLRLFQIPSYSDEKVSITFDGAGGKTTAGQDSVTISVPIGSVLGQNTLPVFTREQSLFGGWIDGSGAEFRAGTAILSDMVVHAMWSSRAPLLTINQSAATVYFNGSPISVDSIEVPGAITLIAEERNGYELGRWVLDGVDMGSAKEPLSLNGITHDSTLSITNTYYSPSTGLNNINNRGMPTTEEVADIIHSFTIGGYVQTGSSVWTGMVSTPLVVDDYIFVRIAGKLYKAESDTGYIVKSVDSKSMEVFYHYLGYGGGYIIDYNTSKVYDLDLNQLYVLDRSISSADYYDGKFYVIGKYVYSFDPSDVDKTRTDEVKTLDYVGRIDNTYGQYGVVSHEFVDGVVYCIINRGEDRGIAAMDLSTGEATYKILDGLRAMYLDDGWITYYRGYLFVTAYSVGLFGAVATTHNDRVSYVPVDGLTFGEEMYYEFPLNTFTSRFAFYDDRAFVTMGGSLYVFDMPEDMADLDISKLSKRSTPLASGHGNFVIDVSHINEDGSPIYAYGIPYDTHHNQTMWIAVDRGGAVSSVPIYSTEREWNSQTVRSDIDGRMLWYNDSGWLYSYTTSDKNVYYFFIEDGDSAVWYRAYGANAADAFASLGNDVATLNSAKIIQSINGHSVTDGVTLQMLKATYGTVDNNGQFDNLDQYSWVTITNLGDVSYSLNHYFRIICGNGESVTAGTEFSYVEDGERKTYTFADNIGDRSIIGKQLSRGTEVVFLRFYDEEGNELPGTASVVKNGSSAKIHFPEVNRVGYVPVWKDSSNNGNEVSDIYGMVFTSNASFYLTWEPLPPGYLVTGTMDTVIGTTTWSADVMIKSGVGSVGDLQVKVTAVTSDGRVLSEMKVTAVDGKASGTFETADVALVYIRIVDEHVEGNLGYAMIEKEARP